MTLCAGTCQLEVSNLFISMQPAIYKAIAQGDYALEQISKSFEQQYTNIVNEAWSNNKDITTMLANNNAVVNGVFEDRLLKLHKKEAVEEEFGTIVSNSGFLTGLARTGRIQIPMAIEQFKAINYSRRLEKANETLEKISKIFKNMFLNSSVRNFLVGEEEKLVYL